MVATTTGHVAARAAVTSLDVVAILCAVVVPPVGAVLGLVSRQAAKRTGLLPHHVSTAAIVIGTLVTGVALLFLLAPALTTVAFLRLPRAASAFSERVGSGRSDTERARRGGDDRRRSPRNTSRWSPSGVVRGRPQTATRNVGRRGGWNHLRR